MLVLDGPMGTALLEAGEALDETAGSAPLSLSRADAVQAIHQRYVEAGAQRIRTNTFLAAMTADPGAVVTAALSIARRAAPQPGAWVGCLGPFGTDGEATDERVAAHRACLQALRAGGCKTLLLETLRTGTEVEAATALAAELGNTVWISVVPRDNRVSLGGDDLVSLAHTVVELPDTVFALNCAGVEVIEGALDTLLSAGIAPQRLGAWPSTSARSTKKLGPTLVAWTKRWPELHALGGCCGATAADIAAVATSLA